jgi:hypothetical protein
MWLAGVRVMAGGNVEFRLVAGIGRQSATLVGAVSDLSGGRGYEVPGTGRGFPRTRRGVRGGTISQRP